MKAETKRAKLAELFGLELPTEPTPDEQIVANSTSREAEAVLAYVDAPKKFAHKQCKECNATFAADRGNVAYCSDSCRKIALASLGISWDPTKDPRERWDFIIITTDSGDKALSNPAVSREPLTVPPQALQVADLFLESRNEQSNEPQQIAVGSDLSESESPIVPIVYNL